MEMILSLYVLKSFEKSPQTDIELATYRYQVLYTKLITLLEISYVSNFFFTKDINNVFQVLIVKLIDLIIWLLLAAQFGFNSIFIVYFALSFVAWMLIGYLARLEHSLIYTRYNKQVSLDPDVIFYFVLLQLVYAITNATKVFLGLRIISTLQTFSTDFYAIYSFVKLPVLLIVEAFRKYINNLKKTILAFCIVNTIFSCFSIYYIVYVVIYKEQYKQLLSFIFEILSLLNTFFLILCALKF